GVRSARPGAASPAQGTAAGAPRGGVLVPRWLAAGAALATVAGLSFGAFGLLRTPEPRPADASRAATVAGVATPAPAPAPGGPSPAPVLGAPAGSGIEVFFSPKGGARERLLREIAAARSTLDICVYNISSEEIAQALTAAKKRGCAIRVICDKVQAGQSSSDVDSLKKAGIEVTVTSGIKGGYMHNKFAIFDHAVLATGSYNWSDRAEEKNRENLLIIRDAETLGRFREEFASLWEGKR
ncbi:MAG: hypothetical protein HZA54_17875, partial [Planctomycetes bacterium]|nr:hypothetical protein [Planctomycetota bacterium]